MPGSPASTMDCGARRTRCASRPRYLAATAVARAWLDCTAPMVTTQSASRARASARRNSSLRTLLPLSCAPVRSSRLTYTSHPSGTPGRCQRWTGVGVMASRTRVFGMCRRTRAHAGGSWGVTVSIPPAAARGAPLITRVSDGTVTRVRTLVWGRGRSRATGCRVRKYFNRDAVCDGELSYAWHSIHQGYGTGSSLRRCACP